MMKNVKKFGWIFGALSLVLSADALKKITPRLGAGVYRFKLSKNSI